MSKSDTDKFAEFAELLRASIEVVSDFGTLLGNPSAEDGIGPLQSENRLPYSRETIMRAICFLKIALSDEKARAMVIRVLSPEEAQYALSERYAQSIEACRPSLDCYVPEAALQSQRQLALDAAWILESLSPDARKAFEMGLPPDGFYLKCIKSAQAQKP